MNIVLPIVFAAVFMGLFCRRTGAREWLMLVAFIMVVIAYNYFKAS